MQNDPDGFIRTLRELGPWILSLLALAQVWVIAAWRRFRKGSVAIHESGNIEIGFSTFGPTVGLTGTLQGLDKDVFVKELVVEVIRMRDQSQHRLGWRAIRPTTISILESERITELELPTSFLLQPEDPFRYSIVFNDSDFVAEHSPPVTPLARRWIEFRETRIQEIREEQGDAIDALLGNRLFERELYHEFSSQPEVVEAYSRLDRAFYWDPGTYSLVLYVHATRPQRSFSQQWRFELREEDSQNLRVNCVAILQTVCGIESDFSFAYATYQDT